MKPKVIGMDLASGPDVTTRTIQGDCGCVVPITEAQWKMMQTRDAWFRFKQEFHDSQTARPSV